MSVLLFFGTDKAKERVSAKMVNRVQSPERQIAKKA